MLEMQRRSCELNGQAVAERDQKISSLKKQLDKLKGENSKSEGGINDRIISFTVPLTKYMTCNLISVHWI